MSRLNEALLNAFSAMSPSNLKAVDQVVKIVRELDRYGGAFAAEWARANAPGRDAPADEDVAFAKAWLGSGEVTLEGGDDRPENPAQGLENIESAPGDLPLAPLQPGEAHPLLREAGKVSPKATDGVWSAATNFVRFARSSQPTAGGAALLAAPHPALSGHLPQQAGEGVRAERLEMFATLGVNGEQGRPENPAQGLEKIESAPEESDGAAALSQPRDAEPCVAPQPDDREISPNASAGADPASSQGAERRGWGSAEPFAFRRCDRPEKPAQPIDKIDSAPETVRPASAVAGFDTPMILTPSGWKPATMRMLLNGVAA